jgi:Holliday junction resolvase-like predicted endonuclease
MSKQANKLTGNRGETLACEFLQKKGYKILQRNYRSKWGEVDIIAKINQMVVFVEVKTKQRTNTASRGDGEPLEVRTSEADGEMWCNEYNWEGECGWMW